MNNKNWIAIFLGLACLVLFVGVISTSNNWFNDNNTNNGVTPQQINQTIRGNDANTVPNQDMPTKINGNEIMNNMGMDNNKDNNDNNNPIDKATNEVVNDVTNAMPNMGR